jgi:hypothetical protein
LQALLQSLASPFAGFGHDLTFNVSQTGKRFGCWFHKMTRLAWFTFCRSRNRYSLDIKDSVKMHPKLPIGSKELVGAGTKGDRREFKRRQVILPWDLSLGRGVEEA